MLIYVFKIRKYVLYKMTNIGGTRKIKINICDKSDNTTAVLSAILNCCRQEFIDFTVIKNLVNSPIVQGEKIRITKE